jgi:phosphate uptake regulator
MLPHPFQQQLLVGTMVFLNDVPESIAAHKMALYHAFSTRDLNRALTVLRTDAEMDRLRKLLFVRHVDSPGSEPRVESVQVLLMSQALERAGDHAKNLAKPCASAHKHRRFPVGRATPDCRKQS